MFEDSILSLSLGSACIMDFKCENDRATVLLPPRSLLIMSGEARYAWSHGICPRHSDIVETTNGITTQGRGTRVSFTFRKVRRGDCCCTFPEYCDTKRNCATTLIDDQTATGIENSYVHEVRGVKHVLIFNFTLFAECYRVNLCAGLRKDFEPL